MPIGLEDREQSLQRIRAMLQVFADTPIATYTRPEFGNAIGFEVLRPSLEQVANTARMLLASPLASLSPYLMNELETGFAKLDQRLVPFRDFNIEELQARSDNPLHVRGRFIDAWDATEKEFWQHLAPVVGFLAGNLLVLGQGGRALQTRVDELDKTILEAREAGEQIKGILGVARESAGKSSAKHHASLFAEESQTSEDSSKTWLKWTLSFVALTALGAGYNVYYSNEHPSPPGTTPNIQLGIAKVILLSVMLSAAVWCGRVYRSLKHNAIVNKHRQNSLTSFETFVSAAGDDQTKNAVLLHAAQAIFAPQSSGFSNPDTEPSTGGTQMVELIRTVNPTQR